ncbi:sulfatase family protein [Fodinibius roseus]|nr:sulfatase [Fodinibius roseus]
MSNRGINRRDFLRTATLGASSIWAGSPLLQTRRTAPADSPNIVVIVTDNMGRDAGCYGNSAIKTPNIDALAADGVKFENAFCTTSSCSPSRAVILSGLYAHANGMYGLMHAYHHFACFEDIQTLPGILRTAGYRTGINGKLHVAPPEIFPFDVEIDSDARNTVQMAEKSRNFISQDDNKPFFLYFCPWDPHRGRPFNAWPEPNPFGNKPEGYEGVEKITYTPEEVNIPSYLPDTPATRAELAQYYQSISRLDQGLGRLISILKSQKKYENTLIMFLSDNGPAFPGGLATLYEPGINLPLIVKRPKHKKKGITNHALVNWTSLTPTILDFADALPADVNFQGRSLKPILEEDHPSEWNEVYASHTFHEVTMYTPMRVLRGRRFKLIWNIMWEQEQPVPRDIWESTTWQYLRRNGIETLGKRSMDTFLRRPEFELFDLQEDPDESNNLAQRPEFADRMEVMKEKIKSFQEDTQDPWVIEWEQQGLEVTEEY